MSAYDDPAGYGAAWSHADPDALNAYFAPDGTYEDIGTQSLARGHGQIARYMRHMLAFASDTLVVFAEPLGDIARFVLPWTWSGTASGPLLLDGTLHPPTHREFSVDGLALCTADLDGRLTSHKDVYDMHGVLRDLGLTGPSR